MENEKLPSITDILEEYKDIELEIVFVGDYNIKQRPYYCKVIFHGKTEDRRHITPIAYMVPEQLNEQYMVGTVFYNMKCIGLGHGVKNSSFPINMIDLSSTKKIRDVVDKSNTRLIWDYKDESEFYLNQYCYLLEYKDSRVSVIIPHYVLANYFYFKSTRLKYTLLEGRMSELCYINSFHKNKTNHYKLRLKRNLLNVERETVCYLLNNEHSQNEYKSFVRYRSLIGGAISKFAPIQAAFPFDYDGSVNTLFKTIQNDDKVKHIILHIYDDSFFKFGTIECEIDDYIKDSDLDDKSQTSFTIDKPKNNGRTNTKKPKSGTSKTKRNSFSLSKYRKKSHISHTEIAIEVPGDKQNINNENSLNEVDGSFENTTPDGDKDTQQIEQEPSQPEPPKNEETKKTNSRIFELNEFIELFNTLKANKKVTEAKLSEQVNMKPNEDENDDIPPKYYTSKDVARKFFYGHFKYNNKNISFLELEHNSSWKSISTWFFVFKDGLPDESFFHEFIYEYLCVYKSIKKVKKDFLSINEIELFSKPHPSTKEIISTMSQDELDSLKKKERERWVELVLEKI